MLEVIQTDEAPPTIGPYVQAVRFDNVLYLSGQLGIDPATRQLVQGGIREETDRALKNLAAVLRAGNSSLEKVVKTTVFMIDLREFEQMNEVYANYFSKWKPARATVEVSHLPVKARVEIELVAVIETEPA